MITPTVTEITRREPADRDPFIDDLRVVRGGGRHPGGAPTVRGGSPRGLAL
jgi:hypothetical protein